MINELIEQIGGRERLEALASFRPSGSNTVNSASRDEWMAMARALLALLEAQSKPALVLRPFGYDGETFIKSDIDHHAAVVYYRATPAASTPDGWKLVPLKAFPSQWAAGQKAFDAAGINKIDPVYHAMVEAAPAPGDKK